MVSMAIASMWASMAAWFTPTVLFCAANLIIATIFIASNNNSHQDHVHGDPHIRISRVSSFLERARSMKLSSYSNTGESEFQYTSESKTATFSSSSRFLQSTHLSSSSELYPSEPEIQPLSQPAHAPSLFERVTSFKLSDSDSPGQLVRSPSIIERIRSFRISSPFDFGATSTSTEPETMESDPGHDWEHHVIRSKSEKTPMKKSRSEMRIAQSDSDDEEVDMRRPETARERRSHDVDEEVDAKADHFINRFKQQLKLQRLESLVRYNQMLNRSS